MAHFLVAVVAVTLTMLGSACWFTKAYDLAEVETARFHERLNAGRLDQIYDSADQELKAATSAEDFTAFLSAVRRKLGRHMTTDFGSSSVAGGGRVTRVKINCSSKFEEGDAQEEFVWLVEGTSCWLASYNISSRTLVLK